MHKFKPKFVVVLGSSGMLGRAWRELLAREQIASHPTTRADVDLASDSLEAQLEALPQCDLLVNAAAWTNVDGAETEEQAATRANGHGVATLTRWAAMRNVRLIHYSTDYVFNGRATSPYPIDHPSEPVNAYGRSKLVGEQAVLASPTPGLLIRTSWLYAPWGNNFVRTIARLADQRDTLKIVNDQRGRPTSCEHLAAASLALVRADARGPHHVTDGGECTWYEFGQSIVQIRGAACQVEPCTTAEFPRPARRPAYSVLDLQTTEEIVGPMPDWRSNLAHIIPRLELPL